MPETQDLYEILQVHPSAHPDVIDAAYRRLALLYHPDKNPSPEAAERMKRINLAYEILGDPNKRAAYDRTLDAQQSQRAGTRRYSAHRKPSQTSGTTNRSSSRPPPGAANTPPETRNGKSARTTVLPLVALALIAIVVVAIIANANQDGDSNEAPGVVSSLPTRTPIPLQMTPAANTDTGKVEPTALPTQVPTLGSISVPSPSPTATRVSTPAPETAPVPISTPQATATPVPTTAPETTPVPISTPQATTTLVPTAEPDSTPTPVPTPTIEAPDNQTISGTGDGFDFIVLEPGRYIVTATISHNCQDSNCNQQFRIRMESVFGTNSDTYWTDRRITEGSFVFLLNVGDSSTSTSYSQRDLLEGKQTVTVTAKGSWIINFSLQDPTPTIEAPDNQTISGTGDGFDFIVLEPGRYIVTATISHNCQDSNCNQQFRIRMESVFGTNSDTYWTDRRITEGSFVFLLNVGDSSTSTSYSQRDLLEGKQTVTVTAKGSWTINFSLQ